MAVGRERRNLLPRVFRVWAYKNSRNAATYQRIPRARFKARFSSAPSCHSHIHPRSHIHQVRILISKSTILRLVGSSGSYYRFLFCQIAWFTWLLIQIYISRLAFTQRTASYFSNLLVLDVAQMQKKRLISGREKLFNICYIFSFLSKFIRPDFPIIALIAA